VSKRERQLDAGAFDRLRDEQARNEDLAEKLRAAEIKIVGLESEVEDLKRDFEALADCDCLQLISPQEFHE
jgi:hypothetical protein